MTTRESFKSDQARRDREAARQLGRSTIDYRALVARGSSATTQPIHEASSERQHPDYISQRAAEAIADLALLDAELRGKRQPKRVTYPSLSELGSRERDAR